MRNSHNNKNKNKNTNLDKNKTNERSGKVITLAGVIGAGKSSLTKILSEKLGTKPFYEPVDNNPVLPLFYEGNKKVEEGEWKSNPYAFSLQVFFLNRRFRSIKDAMKEDNNVLDRSIYEDEIFAKMNYEQGKMSKIEWNMYEDLLDNMMEELPYAAHKKSPDLMILIKVSLPTMLKRIVKRGRDFEQLEYDPSLVDYYQDLVNRYKRWEKKYDKSPLLVIDGDKYDFIESEDDRKEVLKIIYDKLLEIGSLTDTEYKKLVKNLK